MQQWRPLTELPVMIPLHDTRELQIVSSHLASKTCLASVLCAVLISP